MLFFDEADALFGRRGEVKEARDRWANLETNYLLQRIEEFEGIVILSTNLRQNIDEAFMRRIDVAIDFPMPDAALRSSCGGASFRPGSSGRPMPISIGLPPRCRLPAGTSRASWSMRCIAPFPRKAQATSGRA